MFKKITEGLEVFDLYHERHEVAPNPSAKDKLENDLKREVKKLQKLREQIKVWQAQSEVKDKERLLEYRRSVEVAMEKYKVVEKGSKVKAYSNMSLKAGGELDPEEQEKLETVQFVQDAIDELEHQYEAADAELEKINAKKPKKGGAAIKEELKEIQQRYRWHQQQLELALRLLENGELDYTDVQGVKEELEYFLQNNRSVDFVDNEYIYESLDLESNEALQHELITSFNQVVDHEREKEKEKEKEKEQSPEKKAPLVIPTRVKKVVTLASQSPSLSSTLKPAEMPKQELKWSLVAGSKTEEEFPTPVESKVIDLLSKSASAPVSSVLETPSLPNVSTDALYQDESLMLLPAGLQDIVVSLYSSHSSPNTVFSCSTLVHIPRPHLTTQVSPTQASSVELSRALSIWSLVRGQLAVQRDHQEQLLGNLEPLTLFYVFYFAITPFESQVVEKELKRRQWRCDKLKVCWYLKADLVEQGQGFEVGNYRKFDAIKWVVSELLEHKLEYDELS